MTEIKPTLLILAAGLGSRYGGVKQMDKVGPSGESIIDYSVFDAIRAGFGKVVFVVNPKIIDDFKSIYEPRLKGKIETAYVLQEIENIPAGIEFNPDRIKPWGTAHAVMVAKNAIAGPFAVINADDFYGKEAFKVMADFLIEKNNAAGAYAMVGYKLDNTLSDFGSVSRGVCEIEEGLLTDVVERTSIVHKNEGIVYEDHGKEATIAKDAIVSMNFWGFSSDFFERSETEFKTFILAQANELKAEFYIPFVVNKLIQEKQATVEVLNSDAQWFGITYQEDKPSTIQNVTKLTGLGIYPISLWN